MPRRLIVILCCLLSICSWAKHDSIPYELAYRVSGMAGSLIRDDKVDAFIDRPVVGGSFAVEFLPTGRLKSLQQWNNASIGVGATFLNMGNDRMLGQVIAVHGHLNTPFVRLPHFIFGIRPSVGLAFATKTYSNTLPSQYQRYSRIADDNGKPIANQSIGSVVNAYLALELFMAIPIVNGFDITLSGGWHHVSNGSILHPNGGYNMLNGQLGLRYTPGLDDKHHTKPLYQAPQPRVPKRLYEDVDKKWDVEVFATGGIKQNYYRDNQDKMQFYGVASIGIAAHWIPLSIFKLGAGIDAFYDGYYSAVSADLIPSGSDQPKHTTWFKKTYLAKSDIKNCFRVGFSLQPEFVIGRLTAGLHIGFYLFDPIKNLEPYNEAKKADDNNKSLHRSIFYSYDLANASTKQDGWLYTRFVLKYLCTDHLFVQLGLKTHGVRAEFIDAGLGLRF